MQLSKRAHVTIGTLLVLVVSVVVSALLVRSSAGDLPERGAAPAALVAAAVEPRVDVVGGVLLDLASGRVFVEGEPLPDAEYLVLVPTTLLVEGRAVALPWFEVFVRDDLLRIAGVPPLQSGTGHDCAIQDGTFATADGGCKDLATGLVWSTKNMGQPGIWHWESANTLVADSDEGGFTDWRLPTVEEMQTAIANGAETHFTGFSASRYWSSKRAGSRAWMVEFWTGQAFKELAGSLVHFCGVREADGPPPSGDCNNDGNCDPGEDCETCPNDCEGRTGGKPANRFCCGNGIAEGPEGNGDICDGNH